MLINLVAENRNTVFSRKYFQTPELLNFPFNWGLEIARIFVFYLHLQLVESANWGLNFFFLHATEARNLSDIFVESFRLHMLSRFLFIYQLNDCKQINSYHIFSEKLKSYKAVYKYAKKNRNPVWNYFAVAAKNN